MQKKIMLSGFSQQNDKNEIIKIVASLNGLTVDVQTFNSDIDLIVCRIPTRGEKYLCGAVSGIPLLTVNYLKDSLNNGAWLDWNDYQWCHQKSVVGVDEKLLKMPKLCRQFINTHGHRLFGEWKVLLHVEPRLRYKAFKRLLLAGGAQILPIKLPFSTEVIDKITHAFVTKENIEDMRMLHNDKFRMILFPEYIPEYLVLDMYVDE